MAHQGSGHSVAPNSGQQNDIMKMGCLKKLKTMKKKFFVLHTGSRFHPPRLEYFDTEKKFRGGACAKRTIDLSQCFSVNKRCDTKHKFGIVIYTKDDSFSVLADHAEDHDDWLNELREAHQEGICDTDIPRKHYEYVWAVTVQNKGLGNTQRLTGHYRLCLSEESVSLVKVSTTIAEVEFQLNIIRRCGHSNSVFFMEVGRSSVMGEGGLWMSVEDTVVAQSMHDAMLRAMKSASCVFREAPSRSSKPISVPQMHQHETPRVRTTSLGSPRRPHVSVGEKRPKSLYTPSTQPPSAPHISTSPGSPLDYLDDSRYRSNSMESRGSRSGTSSVLSDHRDASPVERHLSSHVVGRCVTPEAVPQPISEVVGEITVYLAMSPGNHANTPSACSSARSSRERLDSLGSSIHDSGAKPDTYMDLTPGESTASVSRRTPSPSSSTPKGKDAYIDMSPLSSVPADEDSYALMGGLGLPSMKSGPSSLKSGPSSMKSGPSSMKSGPSSTKSGPSSTKSGPSSLRSGPSSVKSLSSVDGRDDGYIDMEPGQETTSLATDIVDPGYLSMAPMRQSPILGNLPEMRPDKVYSYLSDDSYSGDIPPTRAYSVGSKSMLAKPTLTYQAYMETVAKQGSLSNSKSSSAPHLIPPNGQSQGHPPATETPSPVMTSQYMTSSAFSKSYKSDDADSFMELDFCRPRTASESYGYRPRTSSFGQAQPHKNHHHQQAGHRQRSFSHGQASKPFLLKKISSESVRTTSQELLRKTSMDSLHKGSKESLRGSQESLRKVVLDGRQKSPLVMDYMEMGSSVDKAHRKPSHLATRRQHLPEGRKDSKEYFDMTVGSPTQSYPSDFGKRQSTPTSPGAMVTVKLTEADSYMEMEPSKDSYMEMEPSKHSYMEMDPGKDSYMEMDPGKDVGSDKGSKLKQRRTEAPYANISTDHGNRQSVVNPYVNISYNQEGYKSDASGSSKKSPVRTTPQFTVAHVRQTSSPASLETSPHKSPAAADGHMTLSPDSAMHGGPAKQLSWQDQKPKSPIPRSPLAEEDNNAYLPFCPGDLSSVEKKNSNKLSSSNNTQQVSAQYNQKKSMKLVPKSPEVLREESDSSYMSFSSDGSLSDSKASDPWQPRTSRRMKGGHGKSGVVHEESDGYMSFSPVNVPSEDDRRSSKEESKTKISLSQRRYNPKLEYKKDSQRLKKSVRSPTAIEEVDPYVDLMSGPSSNNSGQESSTKEHGLQNTNIITSPVSHPVTAGFVSEPAVSLLSGPAGLGVEVVSPAVDAGVATGKKEESAYLEFCPANSSGVEPSKPSNLSALPSSDRSKQAPYSGKKKSGGEQAQRKPRKNSNGSRSRSSQSESLVKATKDRHPEVLVTGPTPSVPEDTPSSYMNIKITEQPKSPVKPQKPITRPTFDPSKVPKSNVAGDLKSAKYKQEGSYGTSQGLHSGMGASAAAEGSQEASSQQVRSASISPRTPSGRSRRNSGENNRGNIRGQPVASPIKGDRLTSVGVGSPLPSGHLPKRGSTPNIPTYSDKSGAIVVGNMLPGDRHSYSEPSNSDLAVANTSAFSPSSSIGPKQSSGTGLNSIASKEMLNYASLDLSSSETTLATGGDGGITFLTAPNQVISGRARHSSANQEPPEQSPFYAEIDFKKSEELKNSKR